MQSDRSWRISCAGQDVAYLPGTSTTVSIDNVNENTNSQFYVANFDEVNNVPGPLKTAYDGLTVPLQSTPVPVTTGVPVDLVFVIADVSRLRC